MIHFGKYDQKITFISLDEVEDEYGGFVPTENAILTTFAAVKQMKGSNTLDAFQLELPKTYEFRIQTRSKFEPNEAMQIKYKGVYHVIKSVFDNQERNNREWVVIAVKI
jgi:SPP1 family predicted phage head-tail adaptor